MAKRLRRLLLHLLVQKRLLFLKARYWLWGIEVVNEALLRSTIALPIVLRSFGAQVGPACAIYGPLVIHNAKRDYSNLRIGSKVHLGRDLLLDLSDTITIGDDAVISMRCTLLTHQDVGDRPLNGAVPTKYAPLTIGAAAYLGCDVTVLAGANIGPLAVVGASALVTKAVAPQVMVAGVPAKIIKTDHQPDGQRA